MVTAVWTELLQAVQSVLQGVGFAYLDGAGASHNLPDERIYLRKLANNRNMTPPCLIVAQGTKEEIQPGDFEDTEVIYPVLVVHEFPSNQDLTPNNNELLWRQQILDAMVNWESLLRPLVKTAEVTECDVETNPVLDLSNFLQGNVDVGGILLQFRTLRGRGRG
jgi:hypothetical protein